MPRLRDVVLQDPHILFVGINPGFMSLEVGHHFAGKFNPFYQLLHAARLVPVVLEAPEDHRLVEFGYALTNLVPRATKMSTDLRKPELDRGRKALVKKVKAMRPKILALVGVTLYPVVAGVKIAKGGTAPGLKDDVIEGARVFVLPNPSGLNASFPTFADKVPWFIALREFAATIPRTPPAAPTLVP
ncbi:MAG: mismatch-specific DNA-glycosylase [Deltaproteobacteria bacterium]|nr:mismatch-specific DNA-glycosylase [Deltaproteobacteria bacterium]